MKKKCHLICEILTTFIKDFLLIWQFFNTWFLTLSIRGSKANFLNKTNPRTSGRIFRESQEVSSRVSLKIFFKIRNTVGGGTFFAPTPAWNRVKIWVNFHLERIAAKNPPTYRRKMCLRNRSSSRNARTFSSGASYGNNSEISSFFSISLRIRHVSEF